MTRRLPPATLIVVAVALQATWLCTGILSAWITDVPSFTASMGPDRFAPWVWLHPWVAAWLGPDRTGITPPPPVRTAQVAFVASLGLACALYVLALAAVRHCCASRTLTVCVVGFALLFVATTAWSPGLVSGDVMLYATFGRAAGVLQLDPYVAPTSWSTLGESDLTWWWFEPTPYGPAWTALSAALAALARVTMVLNPLVQVLTFKLLAGLAFASTLALIWWLVPRLTHASDRDRLTAVTLFAWNPMVVFETGQGHNDLLMSMLLLLAVVPLVGRPRTVARLGSFALLVVNALIKYLPVVVGVFVGVLWLRQVRPAARVRTAASLVAVACGLTAVLVLPWPDPTAVMATMASAGGGGQRYADSIVDIPSFGIVARYLDKQSEHIQESLALVRFWEQVVVRGLMLAYAGWEIRRLWRLTPATLDQALGASVRVMLLIVIFVLTQTLDYYFISVLAVAAALGWSYRWTRVTVAISVLFFPTFYMRRMDLEPVPNVFLIVSLLGPLAVGVLGSAWSLSRPGKRVKRAGHHGGLR